jgi:putative membrane protein
MTAITDIVNSSPAALSFVANGLHDSDGPGWWVIFPITWLLIVGTVVAFVIVNVRRRGRQWGRRAGERRLAERYAAGEIDEEEYRSRLATLRQIGD